MSHPYSYNPRDYPQLLAAGVTARQIRQAINNGLNPAQLPPEYYGLSGGYTPDPVSPGWTEPENLGGIDIPEANLNDPFTYPVGNQSPLQASGQAYVGMPKDYTPFTDFSDAWKGQLTNPVPNDYEFPTGTPTWNPIPEQQGLYPVDTYSTAQFYNPEPWNESPIPVDTYSSYQPTNPEPWNESPAPVDTYGTGTVYGSGEASVGDPFSGAGVEGEAPPYNPFAGATVEGDAPFNPFSGAEAGGEATFQQQAAEDTASQQPQGDPFQNVALPGSPFGAQPGFTGGFGVGSGPGFGVTPGGFSTGYTPFGGGGVGPQFSPGGSGVDTSDPVSGLSHGGVDPTSGSSPGPMDAHHWGAAVGETQRQPGDLLKHGESTEFDSPQLYPTQWSEARGWWSPTGVSTDPSSAVGMPTQTLHNTFHTGFAHAPVQAVTGLATGGIVDGVDYGVDSVPSMLRPGEVVLNEDEQRHVKPTGRLPADIAQKLYQARRKAA